MLNPEDLAPDPKPRRLEVNGAAVHSHGPILKVNGVGLASFAPLPRKPADSLPCDVALGDWDILLRAVTARLRQIVSERLAGWPGPSARTGAAQEMLGPMQVDVLECVTALDQLQATLKHEIERSRQLEREVVFAQTALADARAELIGTQAGERRARHLAQHDSLTSLPNRAYFRERLVDALGDAERHPLAVVYLDLDGFKLINDGHGHDAGDELLQIVAVRMARAVRAGDMVSRIGGDEFACLLVGLPPGKLQLTRLACKLFDAVSTPFKIGKLKLSVRPSIGISIFPADGLTVDALLKNADTAMYRAKQRQTGYAFFDQAGAR
jgi:diguanylate cyclase (GGDEF)-like protein